jgi:excisionase family DNA binding protein
MTRLEAALAELVDALRAELAAPVERPPELLSVTDAGARLGIGRSLVYDEIQAGRLRSVRVGRRRLVPADAIGEYIRSST